MGVRRIISLEKSWIILPALINMIINYFHSISSLQEPVRRRSIILATGLNHFQRLARSSSWEEEEVEQEKDVKEKEMKEEEEMKEKEEEGEEREANCAC